MASAVRRIGDIGGETLQLGFDLDVVELAV